MNDASNADHDDRVQALGDQLVKVHNILRGELNSLRTALDTAQGEPSPPPRPLEEQLRKKCLSFCTFLHGHHTAEDEHMLPGLAASHPELTPVLERLTREHGVISTSLDQIAKLVENGDPARIRGDVERLATEVEAHLDYEEKQIVEALNSYGPVEI
ncbi:hemerythrin domain-containing protein [Nocardiopsis synnemataformans]|uniref:hemerythrin domain-containing protein n=1 Tax=Nocardiopsis synnemataformans TaxID=61305 RepID=UPI003EBA459D